MSILIPFDYEFFRNGFIAAVIIGALCGFIGVFVVLRRMSYIGHGLSHAIFGGAVLSYVLKINFFIGAGVWALLAGGLIHLISHRRWVGADAAIVIPPVIARYLTRGFHRLLILSPVIGALCGAAGMCLSFYFDISSAATIVLTSTALFVALEVGLWIGRLGHRR